ncbi:MAG: TetR/AcrR family transcriptional regulator [Syntrophobacteraceae bacterium]
MGLKLSIAERKNYIARAATTVFSLKGYQTASLEEVAHEAGISKAAIYYYFKSKEDILGYLLITHSDLFLQKLDETIRDCGKNHLSEEESFKRLMRAYAGFINEDRHHRTVGLRDRHQLTGEWKKELVKRERTIFRTLKDELRKIPTLDPAMDLSVTTFLFISMSHWLGYWVKEGGPLTLEEVIDQNIRAVLHGVLGSDRSK